MCFALFVFVHMQQLQPATSSVCLYNSLHSVVRSLLSFVGRTCTHKPKYNYTRLQKIRTHKHVTITGFKLVSDNEIPSVHGAHSSSNTAANAYTIRLIVLVLVPHRANILFHSRASHAVLATRRSKFVLNEEKVDFS